MVKNFFIFAGANGSGKTSLYRALKDAFKSFPFVNADEMLRDIIGNNDPANAKLGQELANRKIDECFQEGTSFVFETVFSHESKVDLVKRAKLLGYAVSIYFVHLSDASENVIRVKRRAELGGHDVPQAKVLSRIPRTLVNVKAALKLVDDFYLFENDFASGHRLVAYRRPLSPIVVTVDAPPWTREMTRLGNEIELVPGTMAPSGRGLGAAEGARHRTCVRCGRFLRGKARIYFRVCSVCQPKLDR